MSRRRFMFPAWPHQAALFAAGALALASMAAQAQTFQPGPAATFDPNADKQRFQKFAPGDTGGGRTPAPVFAPGAGRTGFDSSNARKRKSPQRRQAASAAAPAATKVVPLPPPMPASANSGRVLSQAAAGAMASGPPSPPVPAIGPASPASIKRRRAINEGEPYDALGLRAGSFLYYPALDIIGGYDSNPARFPGAQGSSLITVAPELRVRSDFSRHELRADLRGSYTYYAKDSTPSLSRPFVDGTVDGRIDVMRDRQIDLGARLRVGTDNPNSPNLEAGLAKLPVFTSYGGYAGYTQRFNRLEAGLRGTIERVDWQPSSLVNGASASNADREYTQYGGLARVGYELSPGLKPFVQVDADQRRHDLNTDFSGYQRNSKGLTGKVGATFELTRLLTGDIAVGYTTRSYEDARLDPVKGLVLDGRLLWNATSLTNVTLNARTSVGESVLPGVSGILYRDVGVQVDHALRRWLIATVKFGFGFDTYVGGNASTLAAATPICDCVTSDPGSGIVNREDKRYSIGAGLTYKLSRELHLSGELRQDWLRSNVSGVDYTATVALIGLRLQK